ncbi:hypothetical protein [Polyangium sp. 15x6]|uniref:hypothetical protein n=1 Tax=Polyangium sp. 15x6 TaxID=3042687 RepID=UPI00249B0D0D|nr:hypothetical protein [Polyangium sp. 15x6]MDI3291696.1 hypothetical protein [Polyangium sp. 15x6]
MNDAGVAPEGGAEDAGPQGDDGGQSTPDAGNGGPGYGLDGCWITQTNSSNIQLDLDEAQGKVTGTQSYAGIRYPVENGVVDAQGLRFTVNWSNYNFTCEYNFTVVGPAFLSGVSNCAGNEQMMTADRTCP